MNIIEFAPTGSYPGDADIRSMGEDHYEAYMVLGRTGAQVAVVTGSAKDSVTAISVMTSKLKMLHEQFDLMCHEAFWKHHEKEQKDRMAKLKAALGLEVERQKDEDDEGGLS